MIYLPPSMQTAIRAEGEASYPGECCGFILGKEDSGAKEADSRIAELILPMVNAREPDKQRRRFRIEPDDFMRADKEATAKGLDIIGFYHSHPDHPAIPSPYDLEHALPFYSYVIVAVDSGKAEALTSWVLSLDRVEFNQEVLGKV
ncbi:MAG: M67 family metallopeptidase [Deltaproteobacteria bacterium]|jgi:proteasome lid subunit RPN8/RPN11|nr:M67 family metallopeptidase [Deltaproteobacteria bacterium]